jgi:hypothetical protein
MIEWMIEWIDNAIIRPYENRYNLSNLNPCLNETLIAYLS